MSKWTVITVGLAVPVVATFVVATLPNGTGDQTSQPNSLAMQPAADCSKAAVKVDSSTFNLPLPGAARKDSIGDHVTPIPANVLIMYKGAADRFGIPWTLLAGIGREETDHGRNARTSYAGAQGYMQFMPATFASVGIDGDGDKIKNILSPADSIYSAANYLVLSGAKNGPEGVKKAIYAYNHADWYVNDVLRWAQLYGQGQTPNDTQVFTDCAKARDMNAPSALPVSLSERAKKVLGWAGTQAGTDYIYGGNGRLPAAGGWDCSSFSQHAYGLVGVLLPRTAEMQRQWLASGHGTLIPWGQEQPGDLLYWGDIGNAEHVVIINNPAVKQTIEARKTCRAGEPNMIQGVTCGIGYMSYGFAKKTYPLVEIWRPNP